MIKAANSLMMIFGIVIGFSKWCRAETPLVSVLIKADGNVKFNKLYPIIDLLNDSWQPIAYELTNEPGVSVEFQIRSDVRMLTQANIEKALIQDAQERKVGEPNVTYMRKEAFEQVKNDLRMLEASVVFKTIEILPTSGFSIEAVEALRSQNRRVILICHADWHLESRKIDETILLNPEVIAATKTTKTVVMLVDVTHPLGEEEEQFFRGLGASPLSFVHFNPSEDDPVVTSGMMRPAEFIKLLNSAD